MAIVQRAFLWTVGDRQDPFAFTKPRRLPVVRRAADIAREHHDRLAPAIAAMGDAPRGIDRHSLVHGSTAVAHGCRGGRRPRCTRTTIAARMPPASGSFGGERTADDRLHLLSCGRVASGTGLEPLSGCRRPRHCPPVSLDDELDESRSREAVEPFDRLVTELLSRSNAMFTRCQAESADSWTAQQRFAFFVDREWIQGHWIRRYFERPCGRRRRRIPAEHRDGPEAETVGTSGGRVSARWKRAFEIDRR